MKKEVTALEVFHKITNMLGEDFDPKMSSNYNVVTDRGKIVLLLEDRILRISFNMEDL